jgi:hypothetical protein
MVQLLGENGSWCYAINEMGLVAKRTTEGYVHLPGSIIAV